MTSDQQHRTADTPIAIVGVSGLFPMASDHRVFWQNVVDAADCTEDVPASRWRVEDYYDPDPTVPDKTYCTRGGFVPDVAFSPLEWGLPPNQLEVTTVVQMLSLGVARDLLRDAGAVGSDWYDPSRTGVVLGVAGPTTLSHPLAARLSTPVLREVVRACGLSEQDAEQIAARYAEAFPPWEENSFPGLLGNVIAGRVANRLDLGGMNCTVDAACASSLSAVHIAIGELVSGRADMMITGGADTENSVFGFMCFSKTQALSKSGRIKPFDDSADGTLVGEGIGMLALKRLADAERDGDRVYAVIRGVGSSSDGRFKSIYAPRAEGQVVALRRAYADADCAPDSIGLFEAHATGTRVGDKTELTALNDLLRSVTDERHFAAIGSVKSQIGHTKGAAGAASLIKLAMGLYHKTLPPTINVSKPNTTIDFDSAAFYLNTRTRPWITDPRRPVRRAAASAMGFGGTNFHVVLEEATGDRSVTRTLHETARAWLWHAPTREELLALLKSGAAAASGPIPADHARIGFAGSLEELLPVAVAQLSSSAAEQWTHPSGVYYRRRALPVVKVGALFAGQGSQYVDMGLSAVLNNPLLGGAFDEANAVFESGQLLSEVVYPAASFDGTTDADRELALRRTEYAQPAIGALSAGQFRFLAELGLECAGFLGHSFGELTALWAAGSLADADFFRLARARGLAMAPPSADFDAGAMVAVDATREAVEEILADHPEVSVCNHNAPDQVVVGGATIAVADFVAACKTRGVTAKVLPVAAAFHTSHVGHAVEVFRADLSDVDLTVPSGPVYANTAGASYGESVEQNRAVLAEQLRNPVEFVAGLRALEADGCTVLVEFGPRRVLTDLATRTLGSDVVTIAVDQGRKVDSDLSLKRAAVQLAVVGAPVTDINRHDAAPLEVVAPKGMTVTLTGRDYVPDSRHTAYATALDGSYQVVTHAEPTSNGAAPTFTAPLPAAPSAPAHASRSAAEPLPAASASVPAHSASALSASLPAAATASVPAYAASAAAAAPTSPAATAPFTPVPASSNGAAAAPVAAPASAVAVATETAVVPVPDPLPAANAYHPVVTGFGEVAARHLDLHTRYVEGQLRVADGLVSALRTTPDPSPGLHSAVDAITDQSVAIGAAHIRVNEILAALTELEFSPSRVAQPDPSLAQFPPVALTTPTPPAAPAVPAPAASASPAVPAPELPSPAPEPRHAEPAASTPPAFEQPPPPPAPAAPQPATSRAQAPELQSALLAIVADKTGYPSDMVDLTMDLEADLGVDSIKRVQILGALGERFPELPAVGPEQVAELRTLADVVAHLTAAPSTATQAPDISGALVEIVADKTGYPPDMVDLTMDLEADLGVDSIKRVQILGALGERFPELPAVGPEQVAELRTLADVITYLSAGAPTGAPAPDISAALVGIVADKTGYPVEMVDLTMDLEADLGVDSIKRVQILGTLGERFPSLPAVGPEQVAELRTLADVIAHLTAGAPAATSAPDVKSALVDIVSEKTGYPVEMVDLTMDLEADLGVDSIKRVQILGALGERFPELPAVGPEQVAELRTLADVIAHLGAGQASDVKQAHHTSAAPVAAPAPDIKSALLDIVAEKTGYPVEMIDLTMDLEADLGVDSIKRVQILGTLGERFPSLPAVGPEQVAELRTLADVIGYFGAEDDPEDDPTARRAHLELVRIPPVDEAAGGYAENPVAVVSAAPRHAEALRERGWTVVGPEEASTVDQIDLCLVGLPTDATWAGNVELLTSHLLLAKDVVPALRRTIDRGTRAAFVSVTALDGALGHEGAAAPADALAGGIAGLVKTLRHEVPGLFCRAVDTKLDDPELVWREINDAAAEPVEVGIDSLGNRWTAVFSERPEGPAEPTLADDDVIVVTGGARGVTAACVQALATRGRGEFVLLGRTALTELPDWAHADDLKPRLIEQMRAAGPVTPKDVDRRYHELLAQREIHQTLAAVAEHGVQVRYLAVDITDADAVREALDGIRPTGLVHGAGALADAVITDKTPEHLAKVLGPKLTGLRAVLDAVDESRLRHIVLFASVAGVYGNTGQADYAVANEALGRLAATWKRSAPHRRVTAINWGAWDGGMVTPELSELFKARGIPLLPVATGSAMFAEQFADSHLGDIEVLVGPAAPLAETAAPRPTAPLRARRDVRAVGGDPVIDAHRIGTHPVLPASAALGWIAGALERANPGLRVVEVRGFEVQRGLVFDGSLAPEYWLEATAGVVDGDRLLVNASVVSGQRSHYRGTFVLSATVATAPRGRAYEVGGGTPTTAYEDADLFHGPLLQGVRRVLEHDPRRLVAECALADEPVGFGAYRSALHSPVLGDVVLQAAAVLGVWFLDAGCLPLSLGRWEFFAPLPDTTPFIAVVDNLRDTQMTVTVDVSIQSPDGQLLQRVTDVSVVTTPDMRDKFTEAVTRRTTPEPR
ncbi:type I polyketide synthase [Actinokineospora auranticolor]|uniref:Polyketide-type polyunsaturated fatty acid synthase PfaA n=1 Tax=Actinokineospora auranticolor TaxID=155976 RepID=A0A2S6GI85_9PSEU|nr:type I polyketide synthase [Actinokineospora auranticolor]PPK64903.1 polyketide-type polyunsaturated fatty acid synthase PfaA [Actinokineospora auranticolor]